MCPPTISTADEMLNHAALRQPISREHYGCTSGSVMFRYDPISVLDEKSASWDVPNAIQF